MLPVSKRTTDFMVNLCSDEVVHMSTGMMKYHLVIDGEMDNLSKEY